MLHGVEKLVRCLAEHPLHRRLDKGERIHFNQERKSFLYFGASLSPLFQPTVRTDYLIAPNRLSDVRGESRARVAGVLVIAKVPVLIVFSYIHLVGCENQPGSLAPYIKYPLYLLLAHFTKGPPNKVVFL